MKYFVVIAALCSYVSCVTFKEHSEKALERIANTAVECAEKLGATPEDLDKLMKRQIPENRAGLCVVSCSNKVLGLQNADGTVNKGSKLANIEAVKDIDEDLYKKMASVWDTCNANTVNDSDECITGVSLVKCMKEEGEKLGLAKDAIGF